MLLLITGCGYNHTVTASQESKTTVQPQSAANIRGIEQLEERRNAYRLESREWGIAGGCPTAGHVISSRDGWLSSSSLWREDTVR